MADVVVFSDTTKPPTYTITNLELEYRCISSKFLADQAQAAYKNNHAFFYENILHHKTFTFSKPNDSVINEQINVPKRSMREYYYFLPKTQQQEKEILKNL